MNGEIVPSERIRAAIVVLRGRQVLLDSDLAEFYEVPTGRLNEAVKRNADRFPADFMFQLSDDEWAILKSQSAISNSRGGRRSAPFAFTEQGVAMLSSVLHSDRAVQVNIAIMRTFVRWRQALENHDELARRLDELAAQVADHDRELAAVVKAIQELLNPCRPEPRRIGFRGGGGNGA